ncbi:hypothetical protein ACFLQX_00750 [Bacteroidota bacterium]
MKVEEEKLPHIKVSLTYSGGEKVYEK